MKKQLAQLRTMAARGRPNKTDAPIEERVKSLEIALKMQNDYANGMFEAFAMLCDFIDESEIGPIPDEPPDNTIDPEDRE